MKRALTPVVGIILLVGITIVLSAGLAVFVLDIGNDMSGDSSGAVELSNVETAQGNGSATVTALTTTRTDSIVVTTNASGELTESEGILEESGDTVTIRGSESNSEEIEVEITAIAETTDQSSVVFQQNVTI